MGSHLMLLICSTMSKSSNNSFVSPMSSVKSTTVLSSPQALTFVSSSMTRTPDASSSGSYTVQSTTPNSSSSSSWSSQTESTRNLPNLQNWELPVCVAEINQDIEREKARKKKLLRM